MATSSVLSQLFPLSTEDGKAIPLDVIRPLGIITKSFPAIGGVSVNIPAGWEVATFYSPAGCFVQFGSADGAAPLSEGTEHLNTLLVPPNCIVTSTIVSGPASILSIAADTGGILIIQHVQKWAGLALKRQIHNI